MHISIYAYKHICVHIHTHGFLYLKLGSSFATGLTVVKGRPFHIELLFFAKGE